MLRQPKKAFRPRDRRPCQKLCNRSLKACLGVLRSVDERRFENHSRQHWRGPVEFAAVLRCEVRHHCDRFRKYKDVSIAAEGGCGPNGASARVGDYMSSLLGLSV